jgi:hypothetical protein
MDSLFSPCTRLYAMLESQGRLQNFRGRPEDLQELNMDVSTERLLSAERALSYTDLYAMLGIENVVVWLTPRAAVMPVDGREINEWSLLDGSRHSRFKADGKVIHAFALSSEHLSEICDVVLRLLAASVVHSVLIDQWGSIHGLSINAPTLAYLMERCQSLTVLKLRGLKCLEKSHCRVLGTYSRSDLEINLDRCTFTSAGTSALAEVLGRNQGPTSLTWCRVDYSVLTDGLRGNSRLKSLALQFFCNGFSFEDNKRQVLAIASALRENKGLVEFNLIHSYHTGCDETWYAVSDSLKTHPTLEILNLQAIPTPRAPALTPAVIKSRIQALLGMMKMNMSIHTIHLHYLYLNHEYFLGSVIPYLATNRLRPRIRAIQTTRPIPYREGVLGRALPAARSDANSLWMLLSGNAEVAFPPRTTEIEVAERLPTSTTAAVIPNVAADVTASATSAKLALTNSATASIPTATTPTATGTPSNASTSDSAFATAPSDATPSTDHKLKARPSSYSG